MPTPTPTPKASMNPNFEHRYREMSQHAMDEFNQRQLGQQVKWDRPEEGFVPDLDDFESLSPPFDRSKSNQDYVAAVSDPSSPGTTGDDVVTVTQIEALACMERAYRQRTLMSRCRAVSLMLGRKNGHGSQQGPFITAITYVNGVLQQSASPQ